MLVDNLDIFTMLGIGLLIGLPIGFKMGQNDKKEKTKELETFQKIREKMLKENPNLNPTELENIKSTISNT